MKPAAHCRQAGPLLPSAALSADRRWHGQAAIPRWHGIGGALLPLMGTGSALAAQRGARLLPLPLEKGDTVGLVSPSAASSDQLSLQLAREAMEALGFKVRTGAHYGARYGHRRAPMPSAPAT